MTDEAQRKRDRIAERQETFKRKVLYLLEIFHDRLAKRDSQNVMQFVRYNELGMALEELIAVLANDHVKLDALEYAEVKSVYRTMTPAFRAKHEQRMKDLGRRL